MKSKYTELEATRCVALLSLATPFTLEDVTNVRRETARVSHPDLFHAQGDDALHHAQERMKSVNSACDYLELHFTQVTLIWSRGTATAKTEPKTTPPPPQKPEPPKPQPSPEKQYENDPDFQQYRQEFERWASGQGFTAAKKANLWEKRFRRWPQEQAAQQTKRDVARAERERAEHDAEAARRTQQTKAREDGHDVAEQQRNEARRKQEEFNKVYQDFDEKCKTKHIDARSELTGMNRDQSLAHMLNRLDQINADVAQEREREAQRQQEREKEKAERLYQNQLEEERLASELKRQEQIKEEKRASQLTRREKIVATFKQQCIKRGFAVPLNYTIYDMEVWLQVCQVEDKFAEDPHFNTYLSKVENSVAHISNNFQQRRLRLERLKAWPQVKQKIAAEEHAKSWREEHAKSKREWH